MTDYVKSTNFTAKDALPSGNPSKIVKGSELDTEFSAVAVASATKANKASPTLSGTITLTSGASISTNGATISDVELSYLDNASSNLQTQITNEVNTRISEDALKAPIASPTFTGVPAAPTASTGTSTTQIATTAFVGATAFNTALPAQAGNSGKFVTTDGTNASWVALSSNVYDDATYWMGL